MFGNDVLLFININQYDTLGFGKGRRFRKAYWTFFTVEIGKYIRLILL